MGLSTAVALALAGHRVRVVEQQTQKLEVLQQGQVPFFEPDLEAAILLCADNLCFTAQMQKAVPTADIIILAVSTPPSPAHGADLRQVFAALHQLAVFLPDRQQVLVVKSTVPVGTHLEIQTLMQQLAPDANLAIASNPEFLRQGRALRDAVFPDRIVIGASETWAFARLQQLYAPIMAGIVQVPENLEIHRPKHAIPILEVSAASAELAKYAANAFLAMKISFMNEIANVCDSTGADIGDIKSTLQLDTRIGADFLNAGLGYGGSCFPKDTKALSQLALRSGYEFRLLKAVIEVNNEQKYRALNKLEHVLHGLRDKQIAILGLSFKPDTADTRESIGVDLIEELLARGAMVKAHDPMLAQLQLPEFSQGVTLCSDLANCLESCDAAILVTEWRCYQEANWALLGQRMSQRIMFDGRNTLSLKAMQEADFVYIGIGRN